MKSMKGAPKGKGGKTMVDTPMKSGGFGQAKSTGRRRSRARGKLRY